LEVLEEKKQKAADELKERSQSLEESQGASPNPTPPDENVPNPVNEENNENSQAQNPPVKKRKSDSPNTENPTESSHLDDDEDDSDSPINTSPIETELDISLAAAGYNDDDNLDTFAAESESQKVTDAHSSAIKIPGLGFDPRDRPSTSSSSSIAIVKKDRSMKMEKKQKSIAYKKITTDKCKEAFRNQIANVVITHLNPYRKPDCKSGRIVSTEDFKHLARKVGLYHSFTKCDNSNKKRHLFGLFYFQLQFR
jgi:hypothetical protein